MKKKPRVSRSEIKKVLEENCGPMPIKTLCRIFNCTPPTIRVKLKELRNEGFSILPTRKGIFYAQLIDTVPEARLMEAFGRWVIGGLVGMALIAKIGKRPLLEAKKVLSDKLTPVELKLFREFIVVFKDAADILETDRLLKE